jgi:hypothetical protein
MEKELSPTAAQTFGCVKMQLLNHNCPIAEIFVLCSKEEIEKRFCL